MKIKLPAPKTRYVIGYTYLPTKPLQFVWSALVYGLYSKLYAFNLWTDIIVYGCIALVTIGLLILFGNETQVNPFSDAE